MGYDYGLLVYEDLSYSGSRFKTYGEGVMKVTREAILKSVDRLTEMATERSMVQQPV